jgi:mRNA interferase MazF
MADKITTVARARLGKRVGVLTPVEMAPIGRALVVFLGLAGQPRG